MSGRDGEPPEWLRDEPPDEIYDELVDGTRSAGPAKRLAVIGGGGDASWRNYLTCAGSKGLPRPTIENVLTVLTMHPLWDGVLAKNLLTGEVHKTRSPPTRPTDEPAEKELGPWTDADDARTAAWMVFALDGAKITPGLVRSVVEAAAEKNAYHPIRDWLSGLKFDPNFRPADDWLVRYAGAEDTEYTRLVGKMWLISAVARVMRPGCQADHMLVLEGRQGAGKSTLLSSLVPDQGWFSRGDLKIGDKDARVTIQGKWIFEIDELAAIRGKEAEKVKSFVSETVDNYRPPYGRSAISKPRQTVFAGTTNEDAYLTDPTGSRRYWPVRCGNIDIQGIIRDRQALWAHALALYESGAQWWPTNEQAKLLSSETSKREESDMWEETIAEQRISREEKCKTEGLTVWDFLEALGLDSQAKGTRSDQMRVTTTLKRLGWESRRIQAGGIRATRWFPPRED